MKIEIDENSGFCFGVINAIRTAEEYLSKGENLYCLGDIVHNNEEVNRLKDLGLQVISYEEYQQLHDVTVLIRAHGEPPETYEIAKKNNITIVDSTCRVVLNLQKKIRDKYIQNPNHQILIYGKEGHAEVVGLLGQVHGNGIVLSSIKDIEKIDFSRSSILFAQTTQNLTTYNTLIQEIRNRYNQIGTHAQLEAWDTICRSVAHRAEEIATFAQKFDKVIFVSGIKSSNGLYLYDICKKNNPSTYFISHPEQIHQIEFLSNDNIGICGATSTPMWLMLKIKNEIEKQN